MNKCYIINRVFKKIKASEEDSEVVGVCLNLKDKNIMIDENKNIRWIKNGHNISYYEWLIKDKSRFDTYSNVDFYGDINLNKCCIIKDISPNRGSFDNSYLPERFIGVYTNIEGYEILKKDYERLRWKKYISKISNKDFKTFEEAYIWYNNIIEKSNIQSYESYISENPLSFLILENIPLKI